MFYRLHRQIASLSLEVLFRFRVVFLHSNVPAQIHREWALVRLFGVSCSRIGYIVPNKPRCLEVLVEPASSTVSTSSGSSWLERPLPGNPRAPLCL